MRNRAKRKTALLQDITFLSFSIEYSFLILFALFFSRVQGCVDCNAVRRARGKLVFFFTRSKAGGAVLNFSTKKKQIFRQKQIFKRFESLCWILRVSPWTRMGQHQAKSNYKDCDFGNRDSFVKGMELSVLILAKSQAGR